VTLSGGPHSDVSVTVEIIDSDGIVVGGSNKVQDQIVVRNAKLWWPYTMVKNQASAYLYTLKVCTVILYIQFFQQFHILK